MLIVSISTIPNRIESLIMVLKSLENQTLKPDKIIITVSNYYPRSNKFYKKKDLDTLNNFIQNFSIKTHIHKNDLDIGPVSKLISALQYTNKDDLIITFDDDSIPYNKGIEMLFNSWIKNPDSVYGLMGIRDGNFIHTENIPNDFDYFVVDILGGYRGVIYARNLIEDDFQEWVNDIQNLHNQEDLIPMHDDHIFSYYFKYKGIQRRVAKFIPDGLEGFKYFPIENKDGIFNDQKQSLSQIIINNYLLSRNLEWVLKNVY